MVEEGHRDGRRADGEHPHRVRHPVPGSSRPTATPVDHDVAPVVSEVLDCVVPYDRGGPRLHARTTRSPPPRRPGSRSATGSVRSTACRSPTWEALQQQIRGNDDGEAVIVVRRDGEEVTVQHQHHRDRAARRSPDRRHPHRGRLPRRRPTDAGPHHGRPALHRSTRWATMTVRRSRRWASLPVKVLGRRPRRSSASRSAPPTAPSASSAAAGSPGRRSPPRTGSSVTEKARLLLLLVAGFNFFIGLFNFIPLLPLDGGHIAGALYEAARRGVARLRGRPDPGYVDVAKLLPVAYVVGAAHAGHGAGADRRRPRRAGRTSPDPAAETLTRS